MSKPDIKSNEEFYRVGQFSKLSNVPIRTLHHYNDVGLLIPSRVDEESGYRYYSKRQLLDISTIKYFKGAGFSLKEIKALISRDDLEHITEMIKKKRLNIEKEILEKTALRDKLNIYLERVGKNEESQELNICIKEIPRVRVAYSRYKGVSSQEEFYMRFTKLNNIIEKNSFNIIGSMKAIYYDDYRSYDYNNADIEVCVEVLEDGSETRVFGGFLGAIAYHYGSYSDMNKTYEKLLGWLTKNGFEFVGQAIENYIVDPVTTGVEEEYITEIILPIRKIN